MSHNLEVLVPASRNPGRPWVPGAHPAPESSASTGAPIRIGNARCSTATQELQSQLDALAAARCKRVFSEKISTRVRTRPESEKALKLAVDIKEAVPDQPVVLTVQELKRLARNAAELMTLSAMLERAGIRLDLLTGPLAGVYNPGGMGAMFFAVMAAAAQIERDYIREKTLEGQQAAAARGHHGGRPKVFDDDMLTFTLALQAKGTPVPEIRTRLFIKTGKNASKHPSLASVYRALAEVEQTLPADRGDDLPSARTRFRRGEERSSE